MSDCVLPPLDDVTRALRIGTTVILPLANSGTSEQIPTSKEATSTASLSDTRPTSSDSPAQDALSTAKAPPTSSRRLAEYELFELLGAGGMGMVFRARHVWLDKTVAIKLLPEGSLRNPQSVVRFLREAQLMASLDHPNIVRATDAGDADGVHFLVTELVAGKDLAQVVARGGRLSVADACAVICQAATGLHHAHQQGLIHRDIKPSNLMLTATDNPAGTVKVLDFGLARLSTEQDALTATGNILGTLDFMAPEQAGDPRGVDMRADLYSLGCTFYFLLAGAPPFGGAAYATAASKIQAHLQTPPPELRKIRRDVPRCVLDCLSQLLAKDPAFRPGNPRQVADRLARFAAGADLARLLDSEVTVNDRRVRASASRTVGTVLLAALLLPWTIVCWPFRALAWLMHTLFETPSHTRPRRREPLFSFGGRLMLLGLLILVAKSGFSCIPHDGSHGPWAGGSPQELDARELEAREIQVYEFGPDEPPAHKFSPHERPPVRRPPQPKTWENEHVSQTLK